MRLFQRPRRSWLSDARTWIGVALLGYTLFGFLGVPAILRSQIPRLAGKYLGRDASLRSASFNPFTFVTRLRGFELVDKDGSPLASFDELTVNLQATGLFRRAWTFREIHLVRPTLVGRILGDGRPALADLLEKPAEAEKPNEAFRLPRVLIQDLRIDSGRIEFQDESKSPRFATVMEPLNLRVSDISTIPDQSGDHVLTVGIEGGGEIRWSGRMSVEPLRLEGEVDLRLTRLDRLWEYVGQAYPVRLGSGESHLTVPYLLERAAGGAFHGEAHDVAFDIEGVTLRPREGETDWLRLGRVDLNRGRLRWPERTAEVELLHISEPSVAVWLAEDGAINWSTLMDRLTDRGAAGAGTDSGAQPRMNPGSDVATAPGWKLSCAAIEIAKGAVDFADRSVAPPVSIAIEGIEARADGFLSDGSAPVKMRLSAGVNETGRLSASGSLRLDPLTADADLELSGLALPAFQSYASRVARVQLQSGAAAIRGKASYQEGASPLARFDGAATLDALSLADPVGVRVLAWEKLAAKDIRLAVEPASLRMASVEVSNPFAQIRIDREGKIGAMKLFEPSPSDTPPVSAPAAPSPSTAASPSLPLEIGSIRIHGGRFDYADESLILPFATEIRAAEGSVTDLSSRGAAGSRLLVEGTVGEHGYARAEGTLRVFDPYAASKVGVLFRNVEMSPLTPYTAEFAGYAIKEGRLDLVVDYEIRDRALVGNHKLTATQLTVGDKIEGAKASLPLRLAVALLKDSQGRIELDVPIEGSVDSPEFAYRKVIWGALRRILVNVTTAPFRFLGRLFGREADDLEFVSFEPGRSILLPPEQEKLGKLGEALRSRPELALQVGGRFDPLSDAAALRQDRLEALIAARRTAMSGAEGAVGEAPLDRILDALYAEAFSTEARDALRGKHTSAAPLATTVAAPAGGKRGAPEPTPPQSVFDASGYFEEVRRALLEAQTAGPEDLAALAGARAEAIRSALTGGGGIDAARVTAIGVEGIREKKAGQDLVPCQLAMPAD